MRRSTVLVGLAAAASLASCGGGSDESDGQRTREPTTTQPSQAQVRADEERTIQNVGKTWLTGLVDGDGQAVCDSITRDARRELTEGVAEDYGESLSCPELVEGAAEGLGDAEAQALLDARLTNIEINGSRATAQLETTREGAPISSEIVFRKIGGEWKVGQSSIGP